MRQPSNGKRLAAIRAQLIADGRKALELIAAGRNIAELLMVIGGSRARLYRAMNAAIGQDGILLQTPVHEDNGLIAALLERDELLR
jgi:hypothetical protein